MAVNIGRLPDCWEPKHVSGHKLANLRPAAALFRPFSSHTMMACCVKPVGRGGGSRWLPR